MPVSPNSRDGDKKKLPTPQTQPQQSPEPDGSASDGTGQSRSSRRLKRQNLMKRFSRLREDAQLAGLIQTTPAEAVRDEVVKTADQPQPKLIERAIKSGWAVPDEIKPELVAELTAIVTDESEEASDKTKVAAFRALLAADQAQHERDNPQTKNNKSTVNVSVQTNIAAVDVLRQSMRTVEDTTPQTQTQTPQITEE